MRALVLVATLLWGGFSWWWYVCNIKGYCEANVSQTKVSAEESSSEPLKSNDESTSNQGESVDLSAADTSKNESESTQQKLTTLIKQQLPIQM